MEMDGRSYNIRLSEKLLLLLQSLNVSLDTDEEFKIFFEDCVNSLNDTCVKNPKK